MSDAKQADYASNNKSGGHFCPECGKLSDISAGADDLLRCPSCGHGFSASSVGNRRRDERIKKEISTVLEYHGQCVGSHSKDVSKGGLCVKTSDEFPADTGDTLGLFVGHHRFLARVMWVDKLRNISTVGLQWKSRFINRVKKIWFSAASVGALFYLIFMTVLLAFMFYFAFFR